MAVRKVDPNATESKTVTQQYGLSGNAPAAANPGKNYPNVEGNPNVNPAQPAYARTDDTVPEAQDLTLHLGPDVGSIPAPKAQSPSVHELAVQTVKERGGPNAESQPTFKDQVKQVEEEMTSTIKRTLGV